MVDGREAVEGEVLVRFHNTVNEFEQVRAEQDVEADEVAPVGSRGVQRMRARRLGTHAMLARLRANPDVEFVEPNYVIRIAAVPNDPYFGYLWGLFNSGQFGGAAGADIDAPLAWDISTGTRVNVVGVIDTGIDYTHPDLAANIWSAPTAFSVTIGGVQITCAAGTHGFNAFANSCNPMDDHNHGTHVAGTIGAVGNNGIGVAGVNWTASMMGLKFTDATGGGYVSDAIEAIEFARQAKTFFGTAANVRILSNSWGGHGFSQALIDTIDAANEADMLFVAAAGNGGADNLGDNNDTLPFYPASYGSPNIVAVAATSDRDERASFSNYGPVSVDLAAPGSGILSTVPNNLYAYLSGTSMATPHVSGAAALLLSACAPNSTLSTAALKTALLSSTDPIPALAGLVQTGGRLNINNAIRSIGACQPIPNPVPALSSITPYRVQVGSPAITVTVNGWNFVSSTQVRIDGNARPTTFVSANQLTVSLTASDLATSGTRVFRVFTPAPGGGGVGTGVLDVVPPPIISVQGLTTPAWVAPGASIAVSLFGGRGYTTDWVGLFATGAGDAEFLQWQYLHGTTTLPPPVGPYPGLSFTAPTQPGTYEIRVYGQGWVRLATSATITVAPLPRLSIDDVSITEGNSGATTMTFTVRLTAANTSDFVSVWYATANGTATTNDLDYESASSQLLFAPGVTTRPVTITVNGDTRLEPDETFTVNLSNAVNADIADAQGVGRIVSDEVAPIPTLNAPASVGVGAVIQVQLNNGPANTTDWVGLFAVGAADAQSLSWQYLNGTTTLPTTGIASAALQLLAPSQPGSYEIRLYARGWVRLATSAVISVTLGSPSPPPTPPPSPSPASLVPLASVVSPGGAIQVSLSNGPGTTTDWVGLFVVGAGDPEALQWQYLNGQTTLPAVGVTNGTFHFTAPFQNGSYEVRLYARGWVRLATSPPILVGATPIPPSPTPSPSSATLTASAQSWEGGTIQVILTNGPGTTTDWVGLFPVGGGDTQSVQWQYLNGQTTLPLTGISNAQLQFVGPPPGFYEVRLYARGFVRLATSGTIVVVNP